MAKKVLGFQAEAKQLLKLMTHSLYSNREIFLRELISNAADACDKLRLTQLQQEGSTDIDAAQIIIEFDHKNKTIAIKDNGIGMSQQDVVDNLGTIARSGTAKFLEELGDDQQRNTNLIGQFGVGFYASFIVADKVVVTTRKFSEDSNNGVVFTCDGTSEYSIEDKELTAIGTSVTIFLKKDAEQFCDAMAIKNIVKKYSDHISVPIILKNLNPEPPKDNSTDASKAETAETAEIAETEEQINSASALWTKPAKDIKKEQYVELYKHIAHDWNEPLYYSHNHVEGTTEYISLLYIPKKPTFDLYKLDSARGLKLFIQRTFILDDVEHFLPLYLRFIKGVLDTNNLPMNVSREILQKTPQVEKLKKALTKKALDMLNKLANKKPEVYQEFWQEFGNVLKEGIVEDPTNKDKIAKLLRFCTTKTESEQQDLSLATYLERKQKDQDKIYYLLADSYQKAINSPLIESLKQKDIEVLLLIDPIDEWLMQSFKEFDSVALVDVKQADLLGNKDNKDEKDKKDDKNDSVDAILTRISAVLTDKVEKVVDAKGRLVDSPACLVSSADSLAMRQYMQAMGQTIPPSKPIFEINCSHKLIKLLEQQKEEAKFKEIVEIIFEQSRLAVGEQLDDPVAYVTKVNKLLQEFLK